MKSKKNELGKKLFLGKKVISSLSITDQESIQGGADFSNVGSVCVNSCIPQLCPVPVSTPAAGCGSGTIMSGQDSCKSVVICPA